jgi:hypothetical protein
MLSLLDAPWAERFPSSAGQDEPVQNCGCHAPATPTGRWKGIHRANLPVQLLANEPSGAVETEVNARLRQREATGFSHIRRGKPTLID